MISIIEEPFKYYFIIVTNYFSADRPLEILFRKPFYDHVSQKPD